MNQSQSPRPAPPSTVTAHIKFQVAGQDLAIDLTVPTRPVPLRQMLPLFQALTNVIVDAEVQQTVAEGKSISCKAGCGACCRQLVPISEIEARQIADLIESLPEPRREVIRGRFEEARRKLGEAGLLEALRHPETWDLGDRAKLGLSYFGLGIACPFLEEESCSIHPERPMACREYLVTSPAEHCARPTAETVHCVPITKSIWTSVARLDAPDPTSKHIRFVPLVLAPEWAEAHPDEGTPRRPPEALQDLFGILSGKPVISGPTAGPSGASAKS